MSTGPEPPQPPYDPNQPPGEQPGAPPGEPGTPAQPPGRPPGPSEPAGPHLGFPQAPGPPPQGYGGQPQGYGGQPPMRPDEEKLWAIAAHLGPLFLGLIAPLVVWLVFKDRSPFLDRTAKEALNMQISYLVYGAVAGFSILLLVGLVLLPIVIVAWFVLMIVATFRVASLEDYRYPAIFRLVR
jgi:uncharacterized protein